ncbi:MAG: hypothetical protein Ta2E_09820 [Mycoplasmoidaceae bacterium]|nr:MAG: hypothetical protein Ta2E_09820 [Mycoplasmoidaceae bacterium]
MVKYISDQPSSEDSESSSPEVQFSRNSHSVLFSGCSTEKKIDGNAHQANEHVNNFENSFLWNLQSAQLVSL